MALGVEFSVFLEGRVPGAWEFCAMTPRMLARSPAWLELSGQAVVSLHLAPLFLVSTSANQQRRLGRPGP